MRISLGRDPDTGRYRYASRYVHGTKRDAQRAAAALATEVSRGSHRHRRRHTEAELDLLYGQLARTGPTPLSIRRSHAILSAAFNQAVRWGWVDVNPVLRASPPSIRGREIHPPTQAELRRLLEQCATDHEDLGSLIFAAATTGARRGDLCGLRWSDLDLEAATMTIARSISDAGRQVEVKDTKTHQARRIALDQATVGVLRDHLVRVEERASLAGTVLGPDAYVWSQDLDAATPYRPDRVTGAFRTLRDRLGLPRITFHSLRHHPGGRRGGYPHHRRPPGPRQPGDHPPDLRPLPRRRRPGGGPGPGGGAGRPSAGVGQAQQRLLQRPAGNHDPPAQPHRRKLPAGHQVVGQVLGDAEQRAGLLHAEGQPVVRGALTEERAATPLPLAHRYSVQPHARILTAAVGHTIEHGSQIRQFVTDRTITSQS